MEKQIVKLYCEKCNEEAATEIKKEEKKFVVKDTIVNVTIETRYCCQCGHAVWDEEIEKKNEKIVFDAYRAINNFLSPSEIKSIRQKIGISQATFSRLLGFGEKTIARYENGAPQDAAHNLLIKFMQERRNVQTALQLNKSLLKPREITQINAYLNRFYHVDELILPQNARSLQRKKAIDLCMGSYSEFGGLSKIYG